MTCLTCICPFSKSADCSPAQLRKTGHEASLDPIQHMHCKRAPLRAISRQHASICMMSHRLACPANNPLHHGMGEGAVRAHLLTALAKNCCLLRMHPGVHRMLIRAMPEYLSVLVPVRACPEPAIRYQKFPARQTSRVCVRSIAGDFRRQNTALKWCHASADERALTCNTAGPISQ